MPAHPPHTLIVFAHPSWQHSKANRTLIEAARQSPTVVVRDLYHLYPHGYINAKLEQQALENASAVVLQHPLYWYSVPALLKEWIDQTLTAGWAFGNNGTALVGKPWAHALTAGGSAATYSAQNNMAIEQLLLPLEKTAVLCKANWLTPFSVLDADEQNATQMNAHAIRYRLWLEQLTGKSYA